MADRSEPEPGACRCVRPCADLAHTVGHPPRELSDRLVADRREERIAVREMPVGGVGDDADHARHLAQHDRVRASRPRQLEAGLDERGPDGARGRGPLRRDGLPLLLPASQRDLSGQCPHMRVIVDSVHNDSSGDQHEHRNRTALRHRPTRATSNGRSPAAGKQIHAIQPSDLAMLEDFHSLGRLATAALIDLAQVGAGDRVLDAGTGIGGTARLIAAERGARVTAVDLTPEYCEVAEWLNDAVGLGDMIEVLTADVTELPFDDASFDVVVSQHVQMNVADKRRLYAEARRVLAPGGRLALWDVTAGSGGPLHLPVPWATSPEQSHLVTPERLAELLREAGFATAHWNDLTRPATKAMRDFLAGDRNRRSDSTSSSRTSRPRRPTSCATSPRTGRD